MVAAVLFDLHHVDIALRTTQMILAILIVHTLGDVVDAPVHTVEEEVDIEGIDTGAAYLPLHATCPDITGVLCPLAVSAIPVLPGVAEMTTQHELVELLRFVSAKHWIIQRFRTIL